MLKAKQMAFMSDGLVWCMPRSSVGMRTLARVLPLLLLAAGCGAGRALVLGFKPGAKGGGAGFKALAGLASPLSGEAFLRLACLCMSKKLKDGSVSVTAMAASRVCYYSLR